MRGYILLKNNIYRFVFDKVIDNTVAVVIFTAIIYALITQGFLTKVAIWCYDDPLFIIVVFLLIYIANWVLSYENVLEDIVLDDQSLINEWDNNEKKGRLPTIAVVDDGALYLQLADIPFTYKKCFKCPYALEFRAKVVNEYFAWCVNMDNSDQDAMKGYMFQYDPKNHRLRPHVYYGYNKIEKYTEWISPEYDGSPFSVIENFVLKERNGWYNLRTEVYSKSAMISRQYNPEELNKIEIPVYGNEKKVDRINYSDLKDQLDKYILIRMYDMNNYYNNVYDIIFCTYPSI